MGIRDIKKLVKMGIRVFKINLVKKTIFEFKKGEWVEYKVSKTRDESLNLWDELMERPTFISA